MAGFQSPGEFREVMDRTFTLLRDDPGSGPALRDADTPLRFEFTDVDLVANIRAGRAGELDLVWEWSDDVDWRPRVEMTMESGVANRYFRGDENVVLAIARRRIRTGGDVRAALALMPIIRPLHVRYREMIAVEYPHLAD